jgi:hypothetical protein
MKTGFTNAFANKPVNKAYKYHGINEICNKQPNPNPFDSQNTDRLLCHWDLVYETYIHTFVGYWEQNYSKEIFIPSSDHDPCGSIFPDHLARYFFFEMYLITFQPDGIYICGVERGSICDYELYMDYAPTFYISGWERVVTNVGYLLNMAWVAPGSFVRIWGSSCGELPNYHPV